MDGINLELHLQRTLEIKLVYSPRTQCPSAMEKEAAWDFELLKSTAFGCPLLLK
jgi:hypothetical protein